MALEINVTLIRASRILIGRIEEMFFRREISRQGRRRDRRGQEGLDRV